ncbi:MAG: glycerol-3-phosphate 1-O-acyltransferase PlsY [Candidatus Saganbacteria bacterium]|nr:glycerol-3-phosphate 1-O-acyltransferase PlsY [Candidatus Saganbacteria bacterium]
MYIIFIIILGYLIGSIPFGFLVAKLWKVDIRKAGSGNIGATNVFRTLGPFPAGVVFALDLAKGTIPVLLAQQVTTNPWLILLAGIAAILGHTFPIFLKFKGGRGSATGLGVLLGVAPGIFLGAVILVALIILITRYVSLASITVPILVTVAFYVLKQPWPYTLVSGLVSVFIIIRHIPNIKRLINKTEPKIGVPRRALRQAQGSTEQRRGARD